MKIAVTCPHGFYIDGSRRWKLIQDRLPGGTIETIFSGPRDLSVDQAVSQIEGRAQFPHERDRGQWSLKSIHGQGHAFVADHFRQLVEWRSPWQTAPFCGQCAIARTREESR